jgi:hypothetical protein
LCRLFGVVALEGLEFQDGAILQAANGVLFDDTVAASFDVVDTTADVVVATDLDFLGGVGVGFMFATPFVLEGGLAFDPGAAELALNVTFALDAGNSTDVVLVGIDGAFVNDIVVGVPIAVIQTLAIGHTARSLGREGLASALAAVEPELANFEGFTSAVGLAVFNATSLDQLASAIDGLLAFVDTVVLVHFLLEGDTFARVHTSSVDGLKLGFGASRVLFASVEVAAIFPRFRSLVLLAVLDAARGFEGNGVIATSNALTAVVFVVEIGADSDAGEIFSDTPLWDDLTTLTNVDETTTFDFGSLSIAARTAGGLGWQSRGDRSAQHEQNHGDDLHDDDDRIGFE